MTTFNQQKQVTEVLLEVATVARAKSAALQAQRKILQEERLKMMDQRQKTRLMHEQKKA